MKKISVLSTDLLETLIKDPPMHAERFMIHPDVATWILENKNTGNRKLKPKVQADIAKHGWHYLGNTIVFGKSGVLKDGQNRLSYCVSSEQPIETLVAFGVPDENFTLMDSGARRLPSDAFSIAQVAYPSIAANGVRWIMNYASEEEDLLPTRHSYTAKSEIDFYNSEIDKELFTHCCAIAYAESRGVLVASVVASTLYLAYTNGHVRDARRFEEELESNKGKARALRKLIINAKKDMGQNIKELTHVMWTRNALLGNTPTKNNPFPKF